MDQEDGARPKSDLHVDLFHSSYVLVTCNCGLALLRLSSTCLILCIFLN